jgi:hypothetical protein
MGVQDTIAGMYGDLQGLAGADILEIQALELTSLADKNEELRDGSGTESDYK